MPRPHVYPLLWLIDASPSVHHLSEENVRGIIQLTAAELDDFSRNYPEFEIVMNVIFFGDIAEKSEDDWKPAHYFTTWSLNPQVAPGSNLAPALLLANRLIEGIPVDPPWNDPLTILISDGWFTDEETEISEAYFELCKTDRGRFSHRISLFIGDSANFTALERFQNDPCIPVLDGEGASRELINRFYHMVK